MADTFGLVSRHQNLLENKLYLGRPDLKDSFLWRRVDNTHVLCIRPVHPGVTPIVATFTFVGIAESSEWYNKLSGLGDYNDNYPKPMEKLKWLLHFKSPIGTPFQEDWDVGISALQYAQRKRMAGDPSDLLRINSSGVQSIRTTSNVFKPKQAGTSDPVPPMYLVHAFNVITSQYEFNPINIRGLSGRVITMGPEADKNSTIYISNFRPPKIKHLFVSIAHHESFNASLESVRIIVPKSAMKATMKEMALLSHTQLSSPSPFTLFFAQPASSCSHSLSPHKRSSDTASLVSGSCMQVALCAELNAVSCGTEDPDRIDRVEDHA
ncbi:uncharacterized protein ARMOST_20329 [Armillaria ostoyae]|uniref:Uncharacterized protein n=1 Tax=Armillaria ostoyae TaxID=47428 RepID=A0A284S726_ARMOS|nr:uncharacterized protein ARMOST_20329 [Armillaria ostoyae]